MLIIISNRLNSIKSIQSSTDQQKPKIFTKRSSPSKNLRSISTNNILNRNVQRCGVSRKYAAEKNIEETHTMSQTPIVQTVNRRIPSVKPKTTIRNVSSATITSSFARPLRAFQMTTLITTSEPTKGARKIPATSHHHHITIQKTFTSRTILTTVLPSSNFITDQKNN